MNDDLLKDYLLEAFPNPERKGCPDDETIKALAEDRLTPALPAGLHIGSCSECYAEYRNYREEWKELRERTAIDQAGAQSSYAPPVPQPTLVTAPVPKPALVAATVRPHRWLATAATLLLIVGGGVFAFKRLSPHAQVSVGSPVALNEPVSVRVDLSNAVTARGSSDDPTPIQEVTLPPAVVRLTIALPHFSQDGRYAILVSTDRDGNNVVAKGFGTANKDGNSVNVSTVLDLRKARPGAYFLATVRGSDNGTYYYPLRVQ